MRDSTAYLYLTIRSSKERSLIEAEAETLLGRSPDALGIVVSPRRVDIRRAAYLRTGMAILFEGESLSALFAFLDQAGLHQEGFRVSVEKRLQEASYSATRIAHEVGARIGGNPNLDHPSRIFQVVLTDRRLWFGPVFSQADHSWVQHIHKPVVTSSSLPARLARLVVNLAATPGQTLLDPCCGTGSILIEAACVGIHAVGYDINEKMVRAARQNLLHFGYDGEVFHADARTVQGRFDAVATDLPYGRMLPASQRLYREILNNLRLRAPRHVIVTAAQIESLLTQLGYTIERQAEAPKARFTRYIYIACV